MCGLLDRVYASRFLSEVAGLVMVDAAHEDYYSGDPTIWPLPKDGIDRGVDERQSAAAARAAPPLPDVPLIVLSRSQPDPRFFAPANQRWPEWQLDLSRRAPRGRIRLYNGWFG